MDEYKQIIIKEIKTIIRSIPKERKKIIDHLLKEEKKRDYEEDKKKFLKEYTNKGLIKMLLEKGTFMFIETDIKNLFSSYELKYFKNSKLNIKEFIEQKNNLEKDLNDVIDKYRNVKLHKL